MNEKQEIYLKIRRLSPHVTALQAWRITQSVFESLPDGMPRILAKEIYPIKVAAFIEGLFKLIEK